MNQSLVTQAAGFPPPLEVSPDMAGHWNATDTDFDSAADLLVKAHRADGESRDLPVLDLRTWAVKAEDHHFALRPLADHQPVRRLRNNAFANLASRLGAPVEFLRDRLTAPLQLATLNYLLSQGDRAQSATLRLRGNEIAAVVSERYAPLDPGDFVETVRQALDRHGVLHDTRVRSVATGLVDVLRLTFPGEQQVLKVGDVTEVGLDISTSCFGRSAIHVKGLLWRLVCTNGLRMPERFGSFSFRHVGDAQRLRDGLGDAIPTALMHARGAMNLWRQSIGTYVEHVAEQIEAMRELTVSERRTVEQRLLDEVHAPALPERVSAYDLVNSITASAREAEPARRLEIESVAGRWLGEQVHL